MGLRGERRGEREVVLEFDDGSWCRDSHGEVALTASGVLIDTALGAVTRLHGGDKRQHATVHLHAQFTGASTRGHLQAYSHFQGFSVASALRHGTARGTITCGKTAVAHAAGAFVILDGLPQGVPEAAPSWLQARGPASEPADVESLDTHERSVLEACERAEAAATSDHSFLDRFWCGIPTAGDGKAQLTLLVGPHLGNRVGHVHGGILFAIAARVANAAAPRAMRLANVSAWFIGPGQGPALDARATVVRAGRKLAVVRTEILAASGQRVLEATTQHVADAVR